MKIPQASIFHDLGRVGTSPSVERLQFSTMTSTTKTPEVKPVFKKNILTQRGKTP